MTVSVSEPTHTSDPATDALVQRLYPEVRAGGFTRVDGTVEFYGRVNALMSPTSVVLDFGAGRGNLVTDHRSPYRHQLVCLKGKVAEVIGVDTDPVVLSNPALDKAIVVQEGEPLPLADQSVDMVLSDFCFEHIRQPGLVTAEIDRVLKVGGWICARTPNRWGYIGIAANAIPNRLHTTILRRLQPVRRVQDVFPTEYHLNTRRRLRAHFPDPHYLDCTYVYNAEPAYFGTSPLATRSARALFRAIPEFSAALLYVFMQKRSSAR